MRGRLLYLLGGNGAPNFGDELMAKAWLAHLSATFPDRPIVLDCNSVATPRTYFEGPLPRARGHLGPQDLLPARWCRERFRDAGKNPAIFLDALAYGLDFFETGEAGRHPELGRALDALAEAGSLHIFGGGYINTGVRPQSGFLLGIAAATADRFAIEVFATGVGITPLSLEGQDESRPADPGAGRLQAVRMPRQLRLR